MLALKNIIHFLFLIIFSINCGAKNYCGPDYCNNSKQHTLCKYQSDDPARHCFDYEKTINSNKEKQAILDKLNSRRNKVAAGELRSLPSAADMTKLEWNTELEISAQRWANQCVKHSAPDIKDTCRDSGSVFVGQNIATIYGEAPGLTPLALVDVWYMELLNINASVIRRYQPSSNTGYSHYDYFTQLIWSNAKQVGCGGVKFKERLHDSLRAKKQAVYRLVCNFMPGGNLINQSIYTEGAPCSKCFEGVCDSVHTSLCSINHLKTQVVDTDWTEFESTTSMGLTIARLVLATKKLAKHMERNSIDSRDLKLVTNSDNDKEDNLTLYSFFPHFEEFVRPTLSTTLKRSPSCKNMMVVDDFVELLKKKLSTDPMFKELLQTSTLPSDNLVNVLDAQALVSRIYSKNVLSSTTNLPDREFVNSTLLADLVEAIIFRNGDKVKYTSETTKSIQFEQPAVSPIKIQAELAEVRRNADFTGHLFFPEDLENIETSTETKDSYYDVPIPSLPDADIGDMRPNKVTKDFLEEILESEPVAETHFEKNKRTKLDWMPYAVLKKYKRETNTNNIYYGTNYTKNTIDKNMNVPLHFKKSYSCDSKNYVIKYNELLQRLASDLRVLKLNDRFHCARCYANRYSMCNVNVFLFLPIISRIFGK